MASWCIQLTLTLSQSLPPLLTGETYLCHFASGGVTFTVDAEGNETVYTCNVTGMIPSVYTGLSTGMYDHTRTSMNIVLIRATHLVC